MLLFLSVRQVPSFFWYRLPLGYDNDSFIFGPHHRTGKKTLNIRVVGAGHSCCFIAGDFCAICVLLFTDRAIYKDFSESVTRNGTNRCHIPYSQEGEDNPRARAGSVVKG